MTRRAVRSTWMPCGAAALLGLLLGLLTFAPARLLARALSHPMVQLMEARGTVWQGSARVWFSGGPGSPDRSALPQRLHWTINMRWTGPVLALRAECCMAQPAILALSFKDGPALRVSDHQSTWPAQALAGLGTPWNTLQLSGGLALQTQGLQLRWSQGQLRLAGQARLDLLDLGSALSTLQPMGSYRLLLGGGPSPTLELQTLRGDLLLEGRGQWQASGLQFRGEARATPGREEALANFLNIVGKRDGARALISLG